MLCRGHGGSQQVYVDRMALGGMDYMFFGLTCGVILGIHLFV